MRDRGANQRMYKVQSLGFGHRPRVPRGEAPALPYLNGQCSARREIEHDPTNLVGTPIRDRKCGEVSINQVSDVPVEISKAAWQVLPQSFEHSAHVLVKPRLDNLGSPLVLLLESIPALRNLVPQCGDLARDLIERTGAAVDAAKITLEFDRQRRYQELGSVRPRLMQNVVGGVKDSTEQIQ